MGATSQQKELFEDYEGFVDKFKQKKTTDDCYTPTLVYEAVKDWVVERFNLQGCEIVRPFYPGGDYRNFAYPNNCVVIDNPPFSIFGEILDFYNEHGIKFFIWGPNLTIAGKKGFSNTAVLCNYSATYENGAVVSTSFVTNLMDGVLFHYSQDLYDRMKAANEKNLESKKKKVSKIVFPRTLVSSARLGIFADCGTDWSIMHEDAKQVNTVIVKAPNGNIEKKRIFGGGYLISEETAEYLDRLKFEKDRLKFEKDRLNSCKILTEENSFENGR